MEAITIPFQNPNVVLPNFVGNNGITNKPQVRKTEKEKIYNSFSNPQQILEQTLNNIFPDSREDSKLLKSRTILGEVVKDQTDEELKIFLTELQYLIDSWFDVYEKQVFGGLTLKQILKER